MNISLYIFRSEMYTIHSLQMNFEISAISTKKPIYIIKELKKKKIGESFMKKSLENVQIEGKSILKFKLYGSVVMDSFTIGASF